MVSVVPLLNLPIYFLSPSSLAARAVNNSIIRLAISGEGLITITLALYSGAYEQLTFLKPIIAAFPPAQYI